MNGKVKLMLPTRGPWATSLTWGRFLHVSISFYKLAIISPCRRAWLFILKKIRIPFTQGCFVPSLDEISPVVLVKKVLKYFQYNFTISLLFPLVEGHGPSFEQTWIPYIQGFFVPSLVQIGHIVLEKKIFKYFQ